MVQKYEYEQRWDEIMPTLAAQQRIWPGTRRLNDGQPDTCKPEESRPDTIKLAASDG